MSSLVSPYYLQYLEYLPDLQKTAGALITFTPLFSYGATCYGIYKKKSSVGFSIDICATMLMCSILRIFYYIIRPYEIAILRQSFVMIFIHCILLKISLQYRPLSYNPKCLHQFPIFKNELNSNLPNRMNLSLRDHESYSSESNLELAKDIAADYLHYYTVYFKIFFTQFLNFFDVYYMRPMLFWQWVEVNKYWEFLLKFSGFFGILTVLFIKNQNFGAFIGFLSLFMESLLPLPQILLLNRLQSIKNFKSVLLLSWLGGDCTKIGYLLLGAKDVSIIFILAALFQMGLDLIIVLQYFHFRKLEQEPIAKDIELNTMV
ncbi:uncharacterized protein PRCAT00005503001 [Priceomyces carsonii]|uniref:uncharacterized protein n=1 Tax=Priceomyces carsonii TaxID=28549 RepID=UPI002ED81304|nr:unnamed protein product [Priceomyces carsonii]